METHELDRDRCEQRGQADKAVKMDRTVAEDKKTVTKAK